MKFFKVMGAVMMAAVLMVAAASCKEEKGRRQRRSEKTEATETKPDLDVDKYYIMIGTMGEHNENIRLRYFYGEEIMAVVWYHTPKDYEYGDIFVAKDGIEPEHIPNEDGPYPMTYSNELSSDIELEKIGNCKDLMNTTNLIVTSADYDGMGHWSIHMKDKDENEYYYGFVNDAFFGVELAGAEQGERHVFAMNKGVIIIPLK
ncbi:MAG: hypothetical protein IKS75_07165 [Clostridiales bacterium]|nr:hypothetical protein [Clostridiales bacterium]